MKSNNVPTHMVRAFVLAAMVFLSGCAGFQALPPGSDFGKPPESTEAPIKGYFESTLKDPESARYRFGKVRKAYTNNGLIHGGHVAWHGYMQDVEVNAKNSFGGYVGFKPYMVLFTRDTANVFKVLEGRSHVLVHELE